MLTVGLLSREVTIDTARGGTLAAEKMGGNIFRHKNARDPANFFDSSRNSHNLCAQSEILIAVSMISSRSLHDPSLRPDGPAREIAFAGTAARRR
jgi:hypothetical protein